MSDELLLDETQEFTPFSTHEKGRIESAQDITRTIILPRKPSLFTVITGPRGSLKTLLLTVLICKALLKCFYLRYYGVIRHVWSNYPVGFFHRSVLDGKVYYLTPEPLNMESLYTFDSGLAKGRVFIDEIDQWYDRQDWAAVTQKLTNAVMTQIRKKELSLDASTQNFQWLNARAQFQTDTLINCREAAFTAWGRKNGVQMGHMSFLTFKDLSGVNTGFRYDENFRTYSARLTNGQKYWDKYDTNYQFDPTETKTRYKLKSEVKTITVGANGYEVQNKDNLDGDLHSEFRQKPEIALFSHVLDQLRNEGKTRVRGADIFSRASELGYEGSPQRGGAILSKLGVARNSSNQLYDISNGSDPNPNRNVNTSSTPINSNSNRDSKGHFLKGNKEGHRFTSEDAAKGGRKKK